MSLLRSFYRLKFPEKLTFFKTFYLLYYYKLALPIVPLRRLTTRISQLKEKVSASDPERTIYLVKMASLHLPLVNNCLLRALVGKHLLKQAGLEYRLCFGCRRNENGHFEAHAWLDDSENSPNSEHEAKNYTAFSHL